MTKKNKNLLTNILLIAFIVFLLSPYGLPTKSKLKEGYIYVKSLFASPDTVEDASRIAVGNQNFSLRGIYNAKDVSFNNWQGKVVFINHWATWCPSCRAEMPSLHSLYKDYKDKVVFVFLTSDDKRQVDAYYKKTGFEFPTYNALSAIPKTIDTHSLPATYVIDKQGRVAIKEIGAADWNTKDVRNSLDALINE